VPSIYKQELEEVIRAELERIWRSGGAGREVALSLDDLYIQELTPPSGIDWIDYPSVFTTPEGEVKILFNSNFDVYVADINEDLEISNPLKLPIAGAGASIVYDHNSNSWLLLVISAIKFRRYGLYRLSRDFSTIIASQDPLLVDGYEWHRGAAGCLFYPGGGAPSKTLFAFLDGYGIYLATGDITQTLPTLSLNKWPVTVEAKTWVTYNGEAGKGYAHDGVFSPVIVGDQLLLVFGIHDSFDRGIILGWGTYDETKRHFSFGLDYDLIKAPRGYAFGGYMGTMYHGFITDLLGRGYTFLFTEHFEERTPKKKSYAMRMPWQFLSPKGRRLVYSLWQDTSIDANETTPCIPGWGRKTIHFTSDTPGDLTAYLDAVGRNDWKEVLSYSGVTSVLTQTAYSGLRFRLKFSEAAKVTAHVIVET